MAKIIRLRIGQPGFVESELQEGVCNNVGRDEASTMRPDDENNYWAEAIEDGEKFSYRVNGTTIEITEYEFGMVVSNPSLYYFSTALKLHYRIKKKRQPQDNSTNSVQTESSPAVGPRRLGTPRRKELDRPQYPQPESSKVDPPEYTAETIDPVALSDYIHKSQAPHPQEQAEQESMAEQMAKLHRSRQSKKDTTK